MSGGLPILDIAGAIGGIGKSYNDAFDAAQRKTALAKLGTQIQGGDYAGAARTAFDAGDVGVGTNLLKLGQQQQQSKDASAAFGLLGQSYGGGSPIPSFAGGSATMTAPDDNRETENKFVGALRDGGLTNPFGLAAAAAYARRESGYSPNNITGSWSDPSKSGQPGTSGGILSWRDDRLDNMRAATAGAKDPVTAQAKFFLTEDPNTTLALQNAKSPEEAHAIMAKAWKFAGYDSPGGEYAARLGLTRGYLSRIGGAQSAPTQVASAPMTMPEGASGLNPDALSARPTPLPPRRPSDAQLALAGQPTQVASADPSFMPTAAPAPTQAVAPASDGGDDAADAPAPSQSQPQAKARVSAAAPAHLEQAGLPPQAAAAVGATAPASQQRIALLMRISAMPGLSEAQSSVVGKLLSNEIDQTKLPDTAKQYLFARSAAGGGFDGSYADFVGKSKDEGAKIQAQLKAREDWLVAHGMDPKEAGNQAWIMGGKTASGHVLKPGDILAGPSGKTLAQNAATASSLDDDTANFLADRVLAGDTKALVGLGRGAQGGENLAKIQGLVAQKARAQGIDPTDIQQRAADAAGLGAQARSLGTSAGRMAAAAYEAQGAIQLGLDASASVPRTSFVPLNRAMQMVQANTGDPALKQFVAANNTIINTFARAISPTGSPTVSDKEHAREMLSTADSPEAYAAVLQQMQKEIDMAHKAPEQARRGLEAERQAAKRGGGTQPAQTVPNPVQPTTQPRPAAAATQYHEGQTASGPGGQKVIFSRGQWVPLNPAPSTTASPNAGGTL